MKTLSKSQFKVRALEVLRQIEEGGEPVVITHRGRPTVEVRRLRAESRSPRDRLRGSVMTYEDPFASVGEEDWADLP